MLYLNFPLCEIFSKLFWSLSDSANGWESDVGFLLLCHLWVVLAWHSSSVAGLCFQWMASAVFILALIEQACKSGLSMFPFYIVLLIHCDRFCLSSHARPTRIDVLFICHSLHTVWLNRFYCFQGDRLKSLSGYF